MRRFDPDAMLFDVHLSGQGRWAATQSQVALGKRHKGAAATAHKGFSAMRRKARGMTEAAVISARTVA